MKRFFYYSIMFVAVLITTYFVVLFEPYDNSVSENSSITENDDTSIEVIAPVQEESIFKVDQDIIKSKISSSDKEKINLINHKLSTTDLSKIESYKENEEDGVIDIFKLLEKRLSEDDYSEIKSILSPYIDFSIIEN